MAVVFWLSADGDEARGLATAGDAFIGAQLAGDFRWFLRVGFAVAKTGLSGRMCRRFGARGAAAVDIGQEAFQRRVVNLGANGSFGRGLGRCRTLGVRLISCLRLAGGDHAAGHKASNRHDEARHATHSKLGTAIHPR